MLDHLIVNIELCIRAHYNEDLEDKIIIKSTNKEFEGDISIVLFPLAKHLDLKIADLAGQISNLVNNKISGLKAVKLVHGYLNISFSDVMWLGNFNTYLSHYKHLSAQETGKTIMVEFSSPNTNKPLHLGHIRNNVLGESIANLYQAIGNKVVRVNLVNDRGIHICKSMLAWQKYSNGETPKTSSIKGDHLVGKYYVLFEEKNKQQTIDDPQNTQLMNEAQQMLRDWERQEPQVLSLWNRLNAWVYEGFRQTYQKLGIFFDKTYYESKTYLLGKQIVEEGLNKKIFYKKADGSVWINLTEEGLDEKLLIRSDGTSVYLTQDLGAAELKFNDYKPDKSIYVVGSEQDYHFKVLFLILKKLSKTYASSLYHLSYGMVYLPTGRMKSREGTVVDADDLLQQMYEAASKYYKSSKQKSSDFTPEQRQAISHQISIGALKYYLLKVEAKKSITFNPKEAIDLQGNTGPFIQYTCARINSLLEKSALEEFDYTIDFELKPSELTILRLIDSYSGVLKEAANQYNPSLLASYLYNLAKAYNQFYHEEPILSQQYLTQKNLFQLKLSKVVGETLRAGLKILGIQSPKKM